MTTILEALPVPKSGQQERELTFSDPESLIASLKAPIEPTLRQRQLRALLEAFRRGERLTVAVALHKYGVYALSQRCGELRRMGWPLKSRNIYSGYGAVVAEYWLEP